MRRYAKNRQSAGFAIWTGNESMIEDTAYDNIVNGHGDEWIQQGWVTVEGDITSSGWDVLNDDAGKIERNALRWLSAEFENAVDHGHSGDELVGNVYFDADDSSQVEDILSASREHGESLHSGTLSNEDEQALFAGVTDLGVAVLDLVIEFFDLPANLADALDY